MVDQTDVEALAAEVASGNFPDERLTRRLRKLVSALGEDPKSSLPDVFDSAGLEAAYRFFSNHRVAPGAILSSHFEATRERCSQEALVFVSVHRDPRESGEDRQAGAGAVHRSPARIWAGAGAAG